MSPLRGPSLVDHVIAHASHQFSGVGHSGPATLNGKPLSPSLARYLVHDTDWAEFDFSPMRLSQLMGPGFAVFEKLLPGECYSLRASHSDCTWWFLYAGVADGHGEFPIFLADIDDRYLVKIAYSGFDVFLAERLLGEGYQEPAALQHQAHINFHGYLWCELYGDALSIDGGRTRWEGLPQPSYDGL